MTSKDVSVSDNSDNILTDSTADCECLDISCLPSTRHSVVLRRPHSVMGYFAWPTLARIDADTLAVACSGDRMNHVTPFGQNQLLFSNDEGRTWSQPIIVNNTWLDDRDAGLLAVPDGRILLSWFSSDFSVIEKRRHVWSKRLSEAEFNLIDAYITVSTPDPGFTPGSYVRLGSKDGRYWGEPVFVPVSAPHGPICLRDGSLLYVGRRGAAEAKRCREIDPDSQVTWPRICAYLSRDCGETWSCLAELPVPSDTDCDNFYEPHAIELADGRLLAVLRYEERPGLENNYPRLCLFTSCSEDGGRTWSTAQYLPQAIGAPGHLTYHSSGALLCSYNERDYIAPGCRNVEHVLISYDDGRTWPRDLVLTAPAYDWDIGYPSTAELKDGSLLTVYYEKAAVGGIQDRLCSILATCWELPPR
ncbi:MAG: exo-alpha-sialidase [Clostridiaceae bacterium]|nr:exo-alpha-sialidase [Clostridiaceae bacterium]